MSPQTTMTSPVHGPAAEPAPGSTESGAASAAPPPRPRQRDPFFDNAKYLAIVLVACGHFWEPLKGASRATEALYLVVYAFHMPAFILISGYFSRTFDLRPDRLKRLVTGVLVPYVVFETAYSLFKRWALHSPHHPISLLDPWFLTWFLCALFIWRLLTPLLRIIRWPVPVAVAVAVLASLSPEIGKDLDLQRVLQFLPFFVMGLHMRPEHFHLLRRRPLKILTVPVLAAALAAAYWAAPWFDAGWLYRRTSIHHLGLDAWRGVVLELVLLACSTLLAACFFAWVPRRRTWFTALGAGTLYGYLLHGFVVKGSVSFLHWNHHAWAHTPWGEAVVTVAAAALVTLLCTAPVQRVFRYVTEPRMEWVFRRETSKEAPKPAPQAA